MNTINAAGRDRRDAAVAHSIRFRGVANRYPRRVAEAYAGDLAAAAGATDDEVAARVTAYERAEGLPVRDWAAVGRAEGRPAGRE
jgi:hypothetical protein